MHPAPQHLQGTSWTPLACSLTRYKNEVHVLLVLMTVFDQPFVAETLWDASSTQVATNYVLSVLLQSLLKSCHPSECLSIRWASFRTQMQLDGCPRDQNSNNPRFHSGSSEFRFLPGLPSLVDQLCSLRQKNPRPSHQFYPRKQVRRPVC